MLFRVVTLELNPFTLLAMSETRDIDLQTLWNVVPFIPRIIQIAENIIFSRWFGSNANNVFGDGILHIHVYMSTCKWRRFGNS